MRGVERAVGWLSRIAAAFGSFATVLCLVLVAYSVGMRYLLGQPQPWVDKVAGWLVLALVMLGAAEAQRRFEHIGVDIAISRLGPRLSRASRLLGTLSVAAVAAVLLQAGWEAIEFSLMVGMMTDLEGVPEWWIQMLLPVGAVLMLVVALCQTVILLLGREPAYLPAAGEEMPRDPLVRAE